MTNTRFSRPMADLVAEIFEHAERHGLTVAGDMSAVQHAGFDRVLLLELDDSASCELSVMVRVEVPGGVAFSESRVVAYAVPGDSARLLDWLDDVLAGGVRVVLF